jgi:hypothetical protein
MFSALCARNSHDHHATSHTTVAVGPYPFTGDTTAKTTTSCVPAVRVDFYPTTVGVVTIAAVSPTPPFIGRHANVTFSVTPLFSPTVDILLTLRAPLSSTVTQPVNATLLLPAGSVDPVTVVLTATHVAVTDAVIYIDPIVVSPTVQYQLPPIIYTVAEMLTMDVTSVLLGRGRYTTVVWTPQFAPSADVTYMLRLPGTLLLASQSPLPTGGTFNPSIPSIRDTTITVAAGSTAAHTLVFQGNQYVRGNATADENHEIGSSMYENSLRFDPAVSTDTRYAGSFPPLSRWCECSCDVHSCWLHSVHANLTTNTQLYTLQFPSRCSRN